ncbi:MFS transporter [Sutterella wadsworthensis]|nr:MFS transporter [Sutterella wadsworthensis]
MPETALSSGIKNSGRPLDSGWVVQRSGWGVITRCFLARLRSKHSVRTSVYAGFAVLLLTFASSSLVIPLLAAIRTSLAITTGDAAMTTIAYFAGCAASLLFFGRLSTRFGRRPMAALAALLVLAVLMLLSNLESLAALYIARLLQGICVRTDGFRSDRVDY